jgi:ABC-2 type transport system ATP-binding protein
MGQVGGSAAAQSMHASSPGTVAASMVGLSKRFSATVALDRLDFELRAGEVAGLFGPNGAGKTTTLKLLLGLLKPSSGRGTILGFDCTHDALRVKEHIGFVPDEPQFYDFLTGKESLDFVIDARGLDARAAWASLEETVAAFEFEPQLGALTSSYSHGMKKKLALLCALVHRPQVLLLDEPTNGLDPTMAVRVRTLLRREAERGAAVLVSTHMLDMAERLCDCFLLLNRGKKVFAGTASELHLLMDYSSLEDAFMKLVGT